MNDPVFRASLLKINWTDEDCLKMDEVVQQNNQDVDTYPTLPQIVWELSFGRPAYQLV